MDDPAVSRANCDLLRWLLQRTAIRVLTPRTSLVSRPQLRSCVFRCARLPSMALIELAIRGSVTWTCHTCELLLRDSMVGR